jgi:type II secretory ATPase GspE/PulE/Tfp pilus assembly ATPase PilB-like protein
MGAENYLVASTLIGILAQRLVRKLCRECGGKGCLSCHGSGHAGRSVIMEYLEMSPAVRRLIGKNAGEEEIAAQAKAEGMIAMLDDGMIKARAGLTSEREVLRAVSAG